MVLSFYEERKRGRKMIVTVNYVKEVNSCRECPYYHEEHDMGAIIPLCIKKVKEKGTMILTNPDVIASDCPFIKEQ